MPRDRWRATIDSGRKLDLAKLIQRRAGKPDTNIRCILTYASGETVIADIKLRDHGGWMDLSHGGGQQTFSLVSSRAVMPGAGALRMLLSSSTP